MSARKISRRLKGPKTPRPKTVNAMAKRAARRSLKRR